MIKLLFLFYFFLFPPVSAVNFVLFTEPKTGTHLLIPILETLTGKKVYWAPEFAARTENRDSLDSFDFEDPNAFLFSLQKAPWDRSLMEWVWKLGSSKKTFLHLHAPYSPVMEKYLMEKKCVNFFIRRDPRDQVVSLLNHHKHIHLEDQTLKNISSDDERLLLMIRHGLRNRVMQFQKWQNSPVCCVLDFHKLMGAHGGVATDADALGEMRKIAQALNLHLSDDDLFNVYKKSFGNGWSFFRGKVGSWKDYFKEEHKVAVKEAIGDLLIELGYEKDDQW